MPLLEILQTLHQTLTLLVELLRQEQEILQLPPSQHAEHAERLCRLVQDKNRYFQVLECFSEQRDDLMNVLADIGRLVPSMEERAQCLSLWREADVLVQQALRLDYRNGTLIRQRLNHAQIVLQSLQEIRWTLASVAALDTNTDVQI